MALKDYVQELNGPFCAQLIHVRDTLPDYYLTLGISAADPKVAQHTADTAAFAYLCERQGILVQAGQASTRERNRGRYGDPANPNAALDLAFPSGPASVPSPVTPGIEARFRDFVEYLRGKAGYTQSIGEALHILGDENTGPDPATIKPDLGKLTISGGKVLIPWKWNGSRPVAKAIRLEYFDPVANLWRFLASDILPGFEDRTPFPATPTRRQYRAIFLGDNEEQIGQWSDVVEIVVG